MRIGLTANGQRLAFVKKLSSKNYTLLVRSTVANHTSVTAQLYPVCVTSTSTTTTTTTTWWYGLQLWSHHHHPLSSQSFF